MQQFKKCFIRDTEKGPSESNGRMPLISNSIKPQKAGKSGVNNHFTSLSTLDFKRKYARLNLKMNLSTGPFLHTLKNIINARPHILNIRQFLLIFLF